jgi:hypothetical protein
LDSSLDILKPKVDFDIGFGKIQDLQVQQELIHDAILVFQSQTAVIQSIKWLVVRAANPSHTAKEKLFMANIDRQIDACASNVSLNQGRAKDVLERAKQTADRVSSIMSIFQRSKTITNMAFQITAFLNSKHNHALISNNENLAQLAAASQQDGQNMLAINKSMKKDSATMSLFAVITIVYMPATFVAVSYASQLHPPFTNLYLKTLFSTGFVNASLGPSDISSRRHSFIQAGTYASVTVILTLITLFVPSLLSRRNARP